MIKDVDKFNVRTTIDEEQQRVVICSNCPKNIIVNNEYICELCACPMSYIISQKYKECPLGKWSI